MFLYLNCQIMKRFNIAFFAIILMFGAGGPVMAQVISDSSKAVNPKKNATPASRPALSDPPVLDHYSTANNGNPSIVSPTEALVLLENRVSAVENMLRLFEASRGADRLNCDTLLAGRVKVLEENYSLLNSKLTSIDSQLKQIAGVTSLPIPPSPRPLLPPTAAQDDRLVDSINKRLDLLDRRISLLALEQDTTNTAGWMGISHAGPSDGAAGSLQEKIIANKERILPYVIFISLLGSLLLILQLIYPQLRLEYESKRPQRKQPDVSA